METAAKNINEQQHQSVQKRDDICPALILDKKIFCDAREHIFHPISRQMREFCLNEQHTRCPLFDDAPAQG